MTDVSRHRSVLERHAPPHLGRVAFHRLPEEPDDPVAVTATGQIGLPLVHLDEQLYRDLGRPDTITMTVEPGDHLNP